MYSLWFHYSPEMLCPALCNPMDCSLPGFSVCGISQARILEWVAMPSTRGSIQTRDQNCISYVVLLCRRFLAPVHLGSSFLGSSWGLRDRVACLSLTAHNWPSQDSRSQIQAAASQPQGFPTLFASLCFSNPPPSLNLHCHRHFALSHSLHPVQ